MGGLSPGIGGSDGKWNRKAGFELTDFANLGRASTAWTDPIQFNFRVKQNDQTLVVGHAGNDISVPCELASPYHRHRERFEAYPLVVNFENEHCSSWWVVFGSDRRSSGRCVRPTVVTASNRARICQDASACACSLGYACDSFADLLAGERNRPRTVASKRDWLEYGKFVLATVVRNNMGDVADLVQ